MHRYLSPIQWRFKMAMRIVGEKFNVMPACLKATRHIHQLSLSSAGIEVVNDTKEFHGRALTPLLLPYGN
jgi:hypothetical protein